MIDLWKEEDWTTDNRTPDIDWPRLFAADMIDALVEYERDHSLAFSMWRMHARPMHLESPCVAYLDGTI